MSMPDRSPADCPEPAAGPGLAPPPAESGGARLCGSFAGDYQGLGQDLRPVRVVDHLLKHPARVAYEILEGRNRSVQWTLLGAALLCLLGYGLIMGAYSDGAQLYWVPLKTVAAAVLSALICLPSLYIFSCLGGARQDLSQVAGLLLQALTLASLLLLGFAPVTWVFAQSTRTLAFMALIHLVFAGISIFLGLRLLGVALRELNRRAMPILPLWKGIFLLVFFQMCTMLRPMVGTAQPPQWQEKKFFLSHWVDTATDHGRRLPPGVPRETKP